MTDSITDSADRLAEVRSRIEQAAKQADRDSADVTLIAVSKTFDGPMIEPIIRHGQAVFGENRVQEAKAKWPELLDQNSGLSLHLLGPLQTNKVRDAVGLFDTFHALDREKLARELAKEMARQNKELDLFVQVNTGEEPQKAGIAPGAVGDFIKVCREEIGLTIKGLMCIPPFDETPGPHFALLRKLAERFNVPDLSMGMSADYETAIAFGATYVRVGSAIFGARTPPTT